LYNNNTKATRSAATASCAHNTMAPTATKSSTDVVGCQSAIIMSTINQDRHSASCRFRVRMFGKQTLLLAIHCFCSQELPPSFHRLIKAISSQLPAAALQVSPCSNLTPNGIVHLLVLLFGLWGLQTAALLCFPPSAEPRYICFDLGRWRSDIDSKREQQIKLNC
jgi:hypothetical protein